jgi:transposase
MTRKPYPSDIGDEEWACIAPYLAWVTEDASQRDHSLREIFNGLRWLARSGAQWRMMPNDLPPWYTVYQHTLHWLKAGVFEALAHDLHSLLREIEARVLQSSPESGTQAGYNGHKRRHGSQARMVVNTLSQVLALHVSPANEQEHAQVAELAEQVQRATGESVEVAFAKQVYTGEQPAQDAEAQGMRLEAVKLPAAKRGFILLPRCWVVKHNFAWMAYFPRLARHYEGLPETLAGLHFLAFAMPLLKRFISYMVERA